MKPRVVVFGVLLAVFSSVMRYGIHAQGAAASNNRAPLQPAVPIVGIAQVTFKASDLAKSRAYYQGVLGLPEAFTVTDASVTSAYFKVNDDQYIEITPTLKPGELIRQARVVFQSSDLERLHAIYTERGLKPTAIKKGPDGNPVFRVVDTDGNNLDFLQYVAGSKQTQARGKFLDAGRVTTHIWHVGIMQKDRAAASAFYGEKLGFANGRDVGRGEYVELPSSDRNLETKDPPLDPNNAATKDQYTREVYGAVYHMGLEVADARAGRDLVQKRGGYSDVRVRATVGNNRHWLIHLFDPDGTRSELMETAVQTDVPSGSIMGKNPGDPPIPPPPGAGRGRGGDTPAQAAPPPPQPPAQTPAPAGTAAQTGRGGGRYVEADPINYADHTGWTQMFDGKTLSGWDGPTDLWHVVNGAIVVESKADPPTGPTYLIWQGGEPKDFELLLEVKLDGAGANSGVQFRAQRLGEVAGNPRSKWETFGYQADLDNMNSNTGALIECCSGPRRGPSPRPDRAYRGQVVRTATTDGGKPTLLSKFGDAEALKSAWKVSDWNQLHLIARGRTMSYAINGQLMSMFIDDHPTRFLDHGVVCIQLEGRGDNKASFRNLYIKSF